MLTPVETETIAYLRSPQAIRERCSRLFELACADRLRYFRCDLSQLDAVAAFVLAETRANYPTLDIPFHSRWRHFEVGSRQRLTHLDQALAGMSPLDRTRSKLDLAIVSVLLDAGAGAAWRYREPDSGQEFARSEGLAVASFHLFCQGAFSSNPANPYQVDAAALESLSESVLAEGFQVSPENPLVGLPGRQHLLQTLGSVLRSLPSPDASPRPGDLLWQVLPKVQAGAVEASWVLIVVLERFSEIWAGRLRLNDQNLGDVWQHSALGESGSHQALVPFHKLSQWLTYSLLEPLQALGLTIVGLDELTGLPEYRNGGLCLDLGLLQVKDPTILQAPLPVDSEAIVEWRALTVILLDRIAGTLRQQLQMTAAELPLVKVLQGGTWSAGRKIAAERRAEGVPPLQIISDGTVF